MFYATIVLTVAIRILQYDNAGSEQTSRDLIWGLCIKVWGSSRFRASVDAIHYGMKAALITDNFTHTHNTLEPGTYTIDAIRDLGWEKLDQPEKLQR